MVSRSLAVLFEIENPVLLPLLLAQLQRREGWLRRGGASVKNLQTIRLLTHRLICVVYAIDFFEPESVSSAT